LKQSPGPKPSTLHQVIPATELDLKFDGSKQSLGSGEYSDVYCTTRKVAVKVFKGRFNQQRFKEFKREAEALQTVQNSHGVVRLHGICIDALPNLYLVTEAVLGGSLEQLLASAKGKGLEAKRAVRIGKSIAEGMRDVHAK
jgi:serine/threonine protein kinase